MLPPTLPKTHILGCTYTSMSRCAQDYQRILESLGCYAATLEEAQVVIVHASLGQVSDMLRAMPGLADKYLIGYLVWEADRLPPSAHGIVRYFDEVWTPTWFSAKSFVPWAQRTCWLPHVVRAPLIPPAEAIEELHAQLGEPGHCAMVQIGQGNDARKNFEETAAAFEAACYGRPGMTLVQKFGVNFDSNGNSRYSCTRSGNIVQLYGALTDDAMAALYARSHYVLSCHHGEGWGLTLSEGMAAGTVGIGSNYSGNLAFMTDQNSILIGGYEAEVRPVDKTRNFSAPMRWHYSFPGHIEAAVGRAYDMAGTEAYAAMAAQGRRIGQVYNMRHVRVMMRSHLRAIVRRGGLQPGWAPKVPYRAPN